MKELPDILIAHRGESGDAPENTLESINMAWERGAKAVEVDIQLTRDREIVVFHDTDTSRITGKKLVISEVSLSELRKLNAGYHKGEEWENVKIPTLREVLQTLPGHGRLIIEIKSGIQILPGLCEVIVQSGLREAQLEIIAFDFNTLKKAKKMMPGIKMLWLLSLNYYLPEWLMAINRRRIINKLHRNQLNGVDVQAGSMLDQRFIREFQQAGLLVYAWTVNDPDKARILMDWGIDGITTDGVLRLSKLL